MKTRCLAEADLFCFPTYYRAENQPVNLIESLAFGLPAVTTRWRSVPEILPSGYSALVAPKSPRQVAEALCGLLTQNPFRELREHFLRHFPLDRHLQNMASAIRSVEEAPVASRSGIESDSLHTPSSSLKQHLVR